ncbi:MAG: DUF3305 domain-containing protein [Alphaproteobacteria bacterium]|nr:MAG: DUF3305 domain-containing protein [Alphaproteobacteria bacterium]
MAATHGDGSENPPRSEAIPVGVVVRRSPAGNRWLRWRWEVVALIPGDTRTDWAEMRKAGDVTEFHAGSAMLELHRTETESYLAALEADPPSVFVVFERPGGYGVTDARPELKVVTVSAYEALDYADSGEEVVERLPMPAEIRAWVADFVARHHKEETFVKRRRKPAESGARQDGIGDARIRQAADVYRSPASLKGRK